MSKSLLKKGIDHKGVAERGDAIYETIKGQYEPHHNGKTLAIEVESRDVFLSRPGVTASEQARKAHPGKMIYLVRIGFQSVEAVAKARKHTFYP